MNEKKLFEIVEEIPEYTGRQQALMEYLATIDYPQKAKNNDIEGKVHIRFVIDKDGDAINTEIARGANILLDRVALKHVKNMPDREPGYQKGEPVKVQYVVPINFKLTEDEEEEKEKK